MQTVFHLIAALLGFCIAVASSLPLADGVISLTAQELGTLSLPMAAITQGTQDKRASSNATKVNDDAGGVYTCFGVSTLPATTLLPNDPGHGNKYSE